MASQELRQTENSTKDKATIDAHGCVNIHLTPPAGGKWVVLHIGVGSNVALATEQGNQELKNEMDTYIFYEDCIYYTVDTTKTLAFLRHFRNAIARFHFYDSQNNLIIMEDYDIKQITARGKFTISTIKAILLISQLLKL